MQTSQTTGLDQLIRNLQETSNPPETGALVQAQRRKIGICGGPGNGTSSQALIGCLEIRYSRQLEEVDGHLSAIAGGKSRVGAFRREARLFGNPAGGEVRRH